MRNEDVTIRAANATDLEAIDAIIEACVMRWNLPQRVKRLALGSYLYGRHDLEFMEILLAVGADGEINGLAALETAADGELSTGRKGLLLHGLYVKPQLQGRGIGSRLVSAAVDAVLAHGLDGLLVKAQNDATGFFEAYGFEPMPVGDSAVDYANRWWKSV
ncbi:MAG: GNAT family N-acetyltransferase [Acidihalobacter sp.]|uniref:GNAT family N-acetyltransferase n=1 Tax=Acidihalobacter sp. TaxID=1872108 RepID=UPI00307E9DDA